MFKIVNNLQEYKKFIQEVEDKFDCVEQWQNFFGFELDWNEETGEVLETIEEYKGEISYKPNEFPAIIYSLFEVVKDYRVGDMDIRVVDFISINEIEKEIVNEKY